jgi:hypothetical protein
LCLLPLGAKKNSRRPARQTPRPSAYRRTDDELVRLVYDARGRVVWRYRLVRVRRA